MNERGFRGYRVRAVRRATGKRGMVSSLVPFLGRARARLVFKTSGLMNAPHAKQPQELSRRENEKEREREGEKEPTLSELLLAGASSTTPSSVSSSLVQNPTHLSFLLAFSFPCKAKAVHLLSGNSEREDTRALNL